MEVSQPQGSEQGESALPLVCCAVVWMKEDILFSSLVLHHLWQIGEPGVKRVENPQCLLLASTLGRVGIVPDLGSRIELTLIWGVASELAMRA